MGCLCGQRNTHTSDLRSGRGHCHCYLHHHTVSCLSRHSHQHLAEVLLSRFNRYFPTEQENLSEGWKHDFKWIAMLHHFCSLQYNWPLSAHMLPTSTLWSDKYHWHPTLISDYLGRLCICCMPSTHTTQPNFLALKLSKLGSAAPG